MTEQPIYFNPHKSGLEVFLGPTESRVMELVWSKGPLTVKKTLFFLGEDANPAYTTIMTIMTRLAEKGLLSRQKEGRFFVYSPAVTRETFLTDRLQLVRNCLDRSFPQTLKKGRSK